jgi:hypothetical protein
MVLKPAVCGSKRLCTAQALVDGGVELGEVQGVTEGGAAPEPDSADEDLGSGGGGAPTDSDGR